MDHRKIDAQSPEALVRLRKFLRQELWGSLLAISLLIGMWFYFAESPRTAGQCQSIIIAALSGFLVGGFVIAERWTTYLLQRATDEGRQALPTLAKTPLETPDIP